MLCGLKLLNFVIVKVSMFKVFVTDVCLFFKLCFHFNKMLPIFSNTLPSSGRLQVQILPPKNLGINEGSRAKWTCHVTGEKPENVDIVWTKIGVPDLPAHVEQRGNQLVIESVRNTDQGYYRCTGTSKSGAVSSDEGQLTITTPRQGKFWVD
jgi:hypothetical protein